MMRQRSLPKEKILEIGHAKLILHDEISYLNSFTREKFKVPQLSMVYLPKNSYTNTFYRSYFLEVQDSFRDHPQSYLNIEISAV